MAERRNLVIVRAGDNSLHSRWLVGSTERSWDLVVSYFGDNPHMFRQDDIKRIDGKGPKWPTLKTLIEVHKDLVSQYDYVWLPDDDIDCTTKDINRLFEKAKKYNLALCQPALTLNSYFSWGVTLHAVLVKVRYTNFVEIMVPCFEKNFLFRCLPTMDENLSGFGLDFLWPTLVTDMPCRIGIIDEVTVTHTRPVGGPNHKLIQSQGVLPDREGRDVRSKFKIMDGTINIQSLETMGGLSFGGKSFFVYIILGFCYRYAIYRNYILRKPNRWDTDKALRPQLNFPSRFEY